jgi:hypothetical protein
MERFDKFIKDFYLRKFKKFLLLIYDEVFINNTEIGMNLWLAPQISEHCPFNLEDLRDFKVTMFMRPGTASDFTISLGIVHEWITSFDVKVIRTLVLLGKIIE